MIDQPASRADDFTDVGPLLLPEMLGAGCSYAAWA